MKGRKAEFLSNTLLLSLALPLLSLSLSLSPLSIPLSLSSVLLPSSPSLFSPSLFPSLFPPAPLPLSDRCKWNCKVCVTPHCKRKTSDSYRTLLTLINHNVLITLEFMPPSLFLSLLPFQPTSSFRSLSLHLSPHLSSSAALFYCPFQRPACIIASSYILLNYFSPAAH